jgi:lysozyme family protein
MSFDRALPVIMRNEGGYSDHDADPGGKTKFGITEQTARSFGYTGSMIDLPREFAENVYRKGYWDACRCDELPWPLALCVFDAAVNTGPKPAAMLLQRVLQVKQDGVIGPVTIAAARHSSDYTVTAYMAERAAYYQKLPNYDVFGKGWLRRLFSTLMEGMT